MSTDDEFDSNIPLHDRTCMNKASCSGVRTKNNSYKPFKQNSRKKNQKSCSRNHSAAVPNSPTHNQWMISETPSPYLIGPKKRQSIDKVEQPARSKRTCLSDRFFIPSQNPGRKNGCVDTLRHKQSEDSPKQLFSNVRYSIGKKPYMEPTASFEDVSGRGSYKPSAAFNTVPNMETPSSSSSSSSSSSTSTSSSSSNNQTYPFDKMDVPLDDALSRPSTSKYGLESHKQKNGDTEDKNSLGVSFIDSDSDDSEIHLNISSGNGDQKHKFCPSRKVIGKGLRRVLESEDDDYSDDSLMNARYPNTYRRGVPVISSDSDDSSDIPVPKKSLKKRNPSQLSSTDSNDGSTSGFVYSPTHSRTSGLSKKSSSEHSSDYSRSKNQRNHSHAMRDASREHTNSSSVSSSTSHSSKSMHDHSYPIRGAPKRYAANSSSVSSSTSLSSQSTTSSSSVDRNVRYPHRDSSGRQAVAPLLRVNRSRCQTSLSRSAMGSQPTGSMQAYRQARDFATRYPDVFDPEESSEMEFFTANSYSDTEASISTVESLGDAHVTSTSSRSYPNNVSYSISGSSPSEDEISVIFTGAAFPESASRRRVRHRGGGGRRRRTRGSSRSTSLNSTQDLSSVSPDPVEQVRQMEEDEQFARMLQAQFDAEVAGRGGEGDVHEADEILEASRASTGSDNESAHNLLDSLLDVQMVPFPSSPRTPTGGTMTPILAHPPSRGRTPRFAVPSNIMFLGGGRRRRGRRSHSVQGDPWMFQFARVLGLSPAYSSPDDSDYETLLRFAETVGEEIPRGLRKAEINRLPTRKFYFPGAGPSTSQGHEDVVHKRTELNKECQVCLSDYENGDILRILPCFHEFHTPCIDPWLKINHTCPVCRVEVAFDGNRLVVNNQRD